MLHIDERQEGLTLHFLISLEHLKSLSFVVCSQSHLNVNVFLNRETV